MRHQIRTINTLVLKPKGGIIRGLEQRISSHEEMATCWFQKALSQRQIGVNVSVYITGNIGLGDQRNRGSHWSKTEINHNIEQVDVIHLQRQLIFL